jgi:hypothetical protein
MKAFTADQIDETPTVPPAAIQALRILAAALITATIILS